MTHVHVRMSTEGDQCYNCCKEIQDITAEVRISPNEVHFLCATCRQQQVKEQSITKGQIFKSEQGPVLTVTQTTEHDVVFKFVTFMGRHPLVATSTVPRSQFLEILARDLYSEAIDDS